MRGVLALASVAMSAATAAAGPNVVADDPALDELANRRADGSVGAYSGGFAPLALDRLDALLGRAPAREASGWVQLDRLELTTTWFDEHDRPYNTPLRPRELTAGAISIACQHGEGRPCGDGIGAYSQVDASAGYQDVATAAVRLRAQAGQSYDGTLAIDRLYVTSVYGPVAVEAGRDVVAFGPSSHLQLGWGDNAPPITHVRASTSHPLALTDDIHASAVYLVGRLRAPQRYSEDLVTIGRGQLDLGKNVELGVIQLLQLGGEGAPSFGVWDFIAEHFRRRDLSASATDSSNRRFGGDASVRVPQLAGARFYYSIIFEDIRRQVWSAVEHDADHLFGLELAAIGPCHRHGLTLEYQVTGMRSQEHTPRTTGFTNGGFVVGSPLGPEAKSIYAGGRIELRGATLYPWAEVAWLNSETYAFSPGHPIVPLAGGPTESRYRVGARVRVPVGQGLSLEADARLEHVTKLAFDPAVDRDNAGIIASAIWRR